MNMSSEDAQALSTLIQVTTTHFFNLPDERFIAYVRSEQYTSLLSALAEDEGMNGDLRAGAAMMASYVQNTATLPVEDLSLELGRDRTRLYRGVSSDYGVPYPAEAVWSDVSDGKDIGLLTEQINLAYMRSGMKLASTAGERVDYIGTELTFITHLLQRYSEALGEERGEDADVALCAAKAFYADHMGWIVKFVKAAEAKATTDFYRGHLQIIRGLWKMMSEVFDD